MLTLTLIRHAKSSWAKPGLTDFARPLAPRGLAAGPIIAAWLGAYLHRPNAVRVSAAVRTRATWALLAEAWGEPPPCTFDDVLYLASPEQMLRQIAKSPASTGHLMMIGHNPGLQNLALALMRPARTAERPPELSALAAKYPTAGVVVLAFDVLHWSDVRRGEGRLLHFVSPRRLARRFSPAE
jgi:phosphohistidine phosphatase